MALKDVITSYATSVDTIQQITVKNAIDDDIATAVIQRAQIWRELQVVPPSATELTDIDNTDKRFKELLRDLSRSAKDFSDLRARLALLRGGVIDPDLDWGFLATTLDWRKRATAGLLGFIYAASLIVLVSIFQKLSGGLHDAWLAALTTAQVSIGAVAGVGVIDSFKFAVSRSGQLRGKSSKLRFIWASLMLILVVFIDNVALHGIAEVVYRKGVWFANHKQGTSNTPTYNDALEYYYEAASLDPRAPDYHYDIAWLLYITDDLDKAAEELKKTVQLYPTHTKAWLILASIEIDKREYSRALTDLAATAEDLKFYEVHTPLNGQATKTEVKWKSAANNYAFHVFRGRALFGLTYFDASKKEFQDALSQFQEAYELGKAVNEPACLNGSERFRDGGFRAKVGLARCAEALKLSDVAEAAQKQADLLIAGESSPMAAAQRSDPLNASQYFGATDVGYIRTASLKRSAVINKRSLLQIR